MSDFFSDIDLVKVNIGIIRQATASVSDINQQVVLSNDIFNFHPHLMC